MARVATGRVKRNPLKDGFRNRLSVKGKDPEYEYRFVNDLDDRVSVFQERGWEVVTDKDVTVGEKRVANPTAEGTPKSVSVGGGTTAYLMRIKKDWFDEDQVTKQEYVNQLEASTKPSDEQKRDGFYGKVTIS